MRALLILSCLAVSAFAAYYGERFVAANSDAVLILVTVFTVFAGFLVAVIAILGDPATIPAGSWQIAEMRRDNIEASLITHMWLFVFYLVAIALIFVSVVIRPVPNTIVPAIVKTWVGRTYLFFGISSFLFTFGLANSLFKIQMARIEAEIERRRREAGIPSSGGQGNKL